MRGRSNSLTIHPVTADRWEHLAALFGDKGACAGCWCMWWRMTQSAWLGQKGEGTNGKRGALGKKGPPPGLLAYAEGEPVGWCAVGPREDYPRLSRSKVLAPVDAKPVWSVTCFFVRRDWRRRGVTVALLKEAARFAGSRGARIVEGDPTD